MNIARQIAFFTGVIPPQTRLVAVSKFHPAEAILEAYNAGQRIFGESRVQELVEKQAVLPQDIAWHFIGHLQMNKVKYIVPFVDLIHSIDSWKLLEEVNRQAAKVERNINVLLQLHIAKETSKFGFSFNECRELLDGNLWQNCSHIQICGLMGMATFTDDEDTVRHEFQSLTSFFQEIKQRHFSQEKNFRELSMGMSDDYGTAIACGSTLVRIGSKIFGERSKSTDCYSE
ncbi:MAG: YggS family pyridoxal phosphate-dependent enzyme [Dysgonamonadaceae bacterium]|jgi:pyridoxal phosphate enzyme (YggS family)|nr:YggS family pyridoxal phosphate-dependent enzyme [Dysgonamonadaceae bacterium]